MDRDRPRQFRPCSAANLSFTPIEYGTYTVSLTVTDSSGAAWTTTQSITVTHVAPVPMIQDAASAFSGSTLTVDLTASVPDPGGDDTFAYAWTAIDQTTGVTMPTGSSSNFSFTFSG